LGLDLVTELISCRNVCVRRYTKTNANIFLQLIWKGVEATGK